MANKDELRVSLMPKSQNELMARLQELRETANCDHPAVRGALTRAAMIVVAEAKMNLRRKRIVDQGRLLNSIRFQMVSNPNDTLGCIVEIGAFGVPYAAHHEFGGVYSPKQMRAMFASLRDRGKLVKGKGGKGVMRGRYLPARPYLRPALVKHQERFIELLQEAIDSV